MKKLNKEDYIHGGLQQDYYNENEKESVNCPLCGTNDFIVIDEDRGLKIVCCNKCSLIYVNPRPINAQENYFGDSDVFFNEAKLIFERKKPHHRDKNYIYEIKRIKRIKAEGRLLDVGTNMGFFLRKAQELGYECVGVEPSPSLAKIAFENFGLNIHNCYLEELDVSQKQFDIITLIDVFEHVANPVALLDASRAVLKDDGIVVIKVPNGEYNKLKMNLAKLLRKKNSMDIWDSCEHIVHYSTKTFKQMIAKSGFTIVKTIIPLPIHPPVWANLVGHYYQYPSPSILDWKRVIMRNMFFAIGTIEHKLLRRTKFSPDLMFFIKKIT